MKNIFITFLAVLFFVSYAHAVPLFDVLDTTNNISDQIRVYNQNADGTIEYVEIGYSNSSDRHISSRIDGPDGTEFFVDSDVRRGRIASEILSTTGNRDAQNISYYEGQSRTLLSTQTEFQPLFNGTGEALTMYNLFTYPYHFDFSITDDTLGLSIFDTSHDHVWGPDNEYMTYTLDYDAWDMTHTYTMMMSIDGSTNRVGHLNYLMETNFFDYTEAAAVPEPATFSVLLISLLSIVGFRKKMLG